ncbi:MAG: glycoside hydrolase family 3 C-terminal domain-containing protein, partial [Clostridia bacterium]|nr:glycoside hydrolase family 3 C-terminal domain-containing protein [Clostridia bacterium]
IVLAIIFIVIFVILPNEEEKEEFIPYNPIPQNEDLNFTEEAHRLLSREFAAQSMVLATNNGILPLLSTDQVVLFGFGTAKTFYGGQGSGEVYNKGTSTPLTPVMVLEGIKNKDNKFIYVENDIGYELGTGLDVGLNLTDADVMNFSIKRAGATRSVAILTISRRQGEGGDRSQDSSESGTLLSQSELDTFQSIKKYFDKIVIVLNVGSVMELNDLDKDTNVSILIAFLPGMEAGNAIADVLVGDVNPSGHLTDTWAKTINDYPTTSTFWEDKRYVKYKEGLFVGYRYFEDNTETQSKVVFPFGHGLSYTTFNIESKCEYYKDKKIFKVTSKVTNTGNRPGKQVVQVYVKKPQNEKFVKAQRELVAFSKTKELNIGESQELIMSFELKYLSSYDDTGVTDNPGCYVLEKGDYDIFVGDSVAATRNDANKIYTFKQEELIVIEKLMNRLIPKDPEVADANTKPNFNDLFFEVNKDNNYDEYQYEECTNHNYNNFDLNKNKLNIIKDTSTQNEYSYLPTDKFNEINFKTVLQKKYTMDELINIMSNEELAFLSFGKLGTIRHGTGIIGGFYNSGPTGKYNIPSGDTNDGPAGLRQSEIKMGSTAWPCSTALASSFDVEILRKVGEETGKEARKIGCSFWLAPGMNIHRSPLCGRNFEYYSEDPLISGKMAAAITQGLQSKRVSITLKHFAFNNKEYNRNGDSDAYYLASDSRMAERVAREIYLKGFEIAVKEGKP